MMVVVKIVGGNFKIFYLAIVKTNLRKSNMLPTINFDYMILLDNHSQKKSREDKLFGFLKQLNSWIILK